MEEMRSTPDLATPKGLFFKPLLFTSPKKRASSPENVLRAEFKKLKSKSMQQLIEPYKSAELYKGTSYWYVYYYYINPATEKYDRFKEYFDINRIKDKKNKLIYGQELVKFINKKLAEGYNPFEWLAAKKHGGTIIPILDYLYKDLTKAANHTMKRDYLCTINRFKKYIEFKKIQGLVLGQVNQNIVEDFKSWMLDNKLSKKTINGTFSLLSMFWKKAQKLELTVSDPFNTVERIKKDIRLDDEEKADVYEPITFEELKQIVDGVKRCETPNYLAAIMLIYYAWIRPKEVRQLRVGDIILSSKVIRLKKGNTKNDRGAFVQILNPLYELLQAMELNKYQPTDYLFSDNYEPGAKPVHRLKMSRLWLKIVKDELKIDKNMYALKHTGNIEYLLQNKGTVDLKWMQMQNRHSSPTMTERYIRKLGAYFIEVDNIKFREL